MDKYIDKQYLTTNLKAFKNQVLDSKYASLDADGKISKAVIPSLTSAEVGALPEDTEIPIFTNKEVLDKISADKVADWDEAVTAAHTHNNKDIIDKFTESDEGEVLYNGKQIASGNLWSGTKAEYDALTDKDPDTTYVITDEEGTLADYVIDDSITIDNKTWSSEKIDEKVKDIYSLEEIKTNKVWIDGKPIYRKVIYNTQAVSDLAISSSVSMTFTPILNVDEITQLNILAVDSNTITKGIYADLIGVKSFNPTTGTYILKNIMVDEKLNVLPNGLKIIVEYTKTTD